MASAGLENREQGPWPAVAASAKAELTPLVQMRGIRKEFPGIVANDDVDLEVRRGEILGLLGENGAGKTTLMNILYGLYRPTVGQLFVEGEPIEFNSPRDAIDHGIGMVHQQFMLIPTHSVLENILLASRHETRTIPHLKAAAQRVSELAAGYGMPLDPWARTGALPLGLQQRVETFKALHNHAKLLILDEPTTVLTPQEVTDLLRMLRRLAVEGLAVVFITHKLEEVMAITDRTVVLREGKKIGEVATQNTSTRELARMMVGKDVLVEIDHEHQIGHRTLLNLKNVSATGEDGHLVLKNISLSVREGEIVGVAGIDGNGQRELAEAIVGLQPYEGLIEILGRNIGRLSPHEIHQMGVGIVPEDRTTAGLAMNLTVGENLILEQLARPEITRRGVLQKRSIEKVISTLMREFSIRARGPSIPARQLSGGNQQKVLLARALSHGTEVLIAAQPTRGLDVGATGYVHQRLMEFVRANGCVLLISTELDEIMMLSDRIVVLFEGQIMGVISREDASRDSVGLMMAGVKHSDLGSHTGMSVKEFSHRSWTA